MKTKRVPCLLCKNLEVLWQYWPVHFESAIVYCQHTLGQAWRMSLAGGMAMVGGVGVLRLYAGDFPKDL